MISITLTPAAANHVWECVDAVLRSGGVKNPDALKDLVKVHDHLGDHKDVKKLRKELEAAASAAKKENAHA